MNLATSCLLPQNASTLDELDRVNYPWGAVSSWAVPPGGNGQPGVLRVSLPGIGANVTIGSRSSISGDFDAGSIPHTIAVDDGITHDGSLASLSGSISLINVSVYASNCSALVGGDGAAINPEEITCSFLSGGTRGVWPGRIAARRGLDRSRTKASDWRYSSADSRD